MRPSRFDPPPPPADAAFHRDRATVAFYVLLAAMTLHFSMIGPLLPPLRAELGLSYAEAARHSIAMALGMMGTSLVGERVPRLIGREATLRVAFVGMASGVITLCLAPHLAVSLTGAAMLGASGCLCMVVGPAAMAEQHGARVGTAFGEANVVAYAGIMAAPVIVALAVAAGQWRLAALGPALVCITYLLVFRTVRFGVPAPAAKGGMKAGLGVAYWCFWALLLTTVCVENVLIVWAASYFETALGLPRTEALQASAIFPAGMIVSRLAGLVLMRIYPAQRLVLPALALGLAGSGIFLSATSFAGTVAGLLVLAMGIGNMYPIGITLALSSVRGPPDVAAARVSLASGVAMISAPWLAGTIADGHGLKVAFFILPVCIVAAMVATAAGLRRLSA